MTDRSVLIHASGGIMRVTLARPDARNALDMEMCLALRAAFEDADRDDDIRVVVLGAQGPVFCAGADLKERTGKDAEWVRQRRSAAFAAYAAIVGCGKPVIAAVDGPVVGSGGEMVLSCDFALASPRASFRFPEVRWGTIGATQRLQRAIGKRRAKEMLFTGREMGAQEACRLGIVARLVDEVGAEAEAVAAEIAQAPALAMRLTKRAIDEGGELALDDGIRVEMAAIDQCLADGGWKDGVKRFNSAATNTGEGGDEA